MKHKKTKNKSFFIHKSLFKLPKIKNVHNFIQWKTKKKSRK